MDYQTLTFYRDIADLALKAGVQLDQRIRTKQPAECTSVEGLLQALERAVAEPDCIVGFQASYDVYQHAIAPASSETLRTVDDLVAAISLVCSGWRSKLSNETGSDLSKMLRTVLDVHGFCLARSTTSERDVLGLAA